MGACVEAASGILIKRLPKADMQITCEVGQHGHYLATALLVASFSSMLPLLPLPSPHVTALP